MRIGQRVIKNPDTWRPSEFDGWGAGEGVGIVLAYHPDTDSVDIQWPNGRCFQYASEVLCAPENSESG